LDRVSTGSGSDLVKLWSQEYRMLIYGPGRYRSLY